ncbi:MAG: hypothetical protein K6T85_12040, partial [Gorillibacterium sp.]|nr:hypothetical protein [Gorillibacterium sp.]
DEAYLAIHYLNQPLADIGEKGIQIYSHGQVNGVVMEIISKDEAVARGIDHLEALASALAVHQPVFAVRQDDLAVSFQSWAGRQIEFSINRSGEIIRTVDSAPLVY